MSSKKDKFTKKDRFYMNLAINLAKSQDGLTGLNPSVGCLIVKNKKITSYAVTNVNGRPHAETIALNKNKKNNIGSTVYLTLEPCTHYGKTPPCINALVKSKVKKVGELITKTIKGLSSNPNDNTKVEDEVRKEVVELCSKFPIYKHLI